ncbi:hypothetical protein KC644_02930 [Candidatus Berkelbacteria bacterium]|nr:hypothetical protein [Candidatus Berkelbacteria bacterium]
MKKLILLIFFVTLLFLVRPGEVRAVTSNCTGGPSGNNLNLVCGSSGNVSSGFTPSSVTTPRVSYTLPVNTTGVRLDGVGSSSLVNFGGYGNASGITTRIYLDGSLIHTSSSGYQIYIPLGGLGGTNILPAGGNTGAGQILGVEFTITGATASGVNNLVAANANFTIVRSTTSSPVTNPINPNPSPKIPTTPPVVNPPATPPVVNPLTVNLNVIPGCSSDNGPANSVSLSVFNATGYSLTRDGVSISPGQDVGIFQGDTNVYSVTAWGAGGTRSASQVVRASDCVSVTIDGPNSLDRGATDSFRALINGICTPTAGQSCTINTGGGSGGSGGGGSTGRTTITFEEFAAPRTLGVSGTPREYENRGLFYFSKRPGSNNFEQTASLSGPIAAPSAACVNPTTSGNQFIHSAEAIYRPMRFEFTNNRESQQDVEFDLIQAGNRGVIVTAQDANGDYIFMRNVDSPDAGRPPASPGRCTATHIVVTPVVAGKKVNLIEFTPTGAGTTNGFGVDTLEYGPLQ